MNLQFNEEEDLFDKKKVTIVLDKRNGKKCITSVIGMAEDLDLKKILSHIKKTYSCNGAIKKDPNEGEIMTFSGDQKENFYNFLINEEICKKDEIIFKGI